MDHTETSLMELNKKDLAGLLLDYQVKFCSVLDYLKNKFDELKAKFTKLEADLNISRNVNSKLSDKRINGDRKIFANKQYFRKFQAFLLLSRIMNWRPKYSAFWKKLTLDWKSTVTAYYPKENRRR